MLTLNLVILKLIVVLITQPYTFITFAFINMTMMVLGQDKLGELLIDVFYTLTF